MNEIWKDVTSQFQIDWIDGECVGIGKCACGDESTMVLGVYHDDPVECEGCSKKFFVSIVVNVFEAEE